VSEESCFVNSARSSVWIGQYIGVIRSKPDERKLFNVPALVGKGTNCGCIILHGESGGDVDGWFIESVDAVAKSTNESPIGFSGSIIVSGLSEELRCTTLD
jgi:hypothetical protein